MMAIGVGGAKWADPPPDHGHADSQSQRSQNYSLATTAATYCGPMAYKYNTHIVDGIPVPTFITQERMDQLKDFSLRSDDLFIVTFPKSGTTWLQQIVKLIRNNGREDGVRIVDASPWLEALKPSDSNVDGMPSPRTFKSHTPYHTMPGGPPHTSPAKYIYIARNPKDVAVSLYYHSRAFQSFEYSGPWEHFFQLFMDGKAEYGVWFDHVLEWWKHKDDSNVLFLRFEDMKKDLPGAVKTVADFMRCDLSEEVLSKITEQSTFESMKVSDTTNYSWTARKTSEPPFMRKGSVGDWRSLFTQEQSAEVDGIYADRIKGTGLDFTF